MFGEIVFAADSRGDHKAVAGFSRGLASLSSSYEVDAASS